MARSVRLVPSCLILVLVFGVACAASQAGASDIQRLGGQDIVLPGFSPISIEDRRIRLGAGRVIDWQDTLLPGAISVAGNSFVGAMSFAIEIDNEVHRLRSQSFNIVDWSGHDVSLVTFGRHRDQLEFRVRARIEFDGLVSVHVTMIPLGDRAVKIRGVNLNVPIEKNRNARLLGYSTDSIYRYKREVFPACGSQPYKAVLSVADTSRGFWFVADEPAFRRGQSQRPTTILRCDSDAIELAQPLVGPLTLFSPVEFDFAFLVTPVREMPPHLRRDRVVPNVDRAEAGLGNRHLWWVDAFPHYALPATEIPSDSRRRISHADVAAYPGLRANRRRLAEWRATGLERLPYLSLRAPSALDPISRADQSRWRVVPQRATPPAGDGPYRTGIARPFYSHRAPGFSDYYLRRIDQVLDELDVRGFYFDQASPIGSANPSHLRNDRRLRPDMASDVLAMRQFFKRLATLLHLRGHDPLIYVHNSMATVLPAYTFVTAMVQGEEFNTPRLKKLNYLASVDFETVQATYVSRQFGVPVIWLEELWSGYWVKERPRRFRNNTKAWLRSDKYDRLWRNFMSVALLHDTPVWTNAIPERRAELYAELDRFGLDRSRFVGYWDLDADWRSRSVLISWYVRDDESRLGVIANLTDRQIRIESAHLAPFVSRASDRLSRLVGRRIPAQDFVLATI